MYESFYGFRERPFDLTPNPRFLVMTDVHREALSNLEYGIASRTGITLLVGDAGTGKTTLIRTALERQPERVHCVHLQNPALTRGEFVEMLAWRFDLSDRARESKTALLLELEEVLKRRADAGESTVLLIDEAQSLPRDILEEIRLLANIETNERKLLSVIMAGQPEVTSLLNDESLRQLKQRVALRCELRPLTLQEGYTALLRKSEESKIAVNLERRQIGEQFKIIDGARLPEKPISPDRLRINGMGILGGLALGLALVAFLEYRDTSFKNDDDVMTTLALPVLAVIPVLTNAGERRVARRRKLLLAASASVTCMLLAAAVMVVWQYQLLDRFLK
jgi:type II secretory pathway predicted ATPase ExeA